MPEPTPIDRSHAAELDHIDASIATLDARERLALAVADAALDRAIAVHHLREREGLEKGREPEPDNAR